MERRRGSENWAGMDQHNDLTGEAAVDMLVGMLHNNEIGRPASPRATLISGSWSPGAGCPHSTHSAASSPPPTPTPRAGKSPCTGDPATTPTCSPRRSRNPTRHLCGWWNTSARQWALGVIAANL